MKVAIIGAGMAGLSCADLLQHKGHCVALFDKGRGAGGRMSSRCLATPLGEVTIDHGAQYFTARHPDFSRLVGVWQDQGFAALWPEAGSDTWVGVPAMNTVIKAMAAPHDVTWSCQVTAIARSHQQWALLSAGGEIGPFDVVILAIPAEQGQNRAHGAVTALLDRDVRFRSCGKLRALGYPQRWRDCMGRVQQHQERARRARNLGRAGQRRLVANSLRRRTWRDRQPAVGGPV
jgi:predicted NAD/FAD-dependent oxidoreductase